MEEIQIAYGIGYGLACLGSGMALGWVLCTTYLRRTALRMLRDEREDRRQG